MSDQDRCVGFADCPCRRCRATRVAHTEAHPNHGHPQDAVYCGVCRTKVTQLHRVRL